MILDAWSESEFGDLGDKRRTLRAARVASQLVAADGGSVLRNMGTVAAAKACYRLLNLPEMDHPALLSAHVQNSLQRARAHRVVLAVQDTTSVSYGGREQIAGLGPIDSALRVQGLLVHTTLLVQPERGEVLGVAHQQVWVRPWTRANADETGAERKLRARESEHWGYGQIGLATSSGRSVGENGQWSPIFEGDPHVIAVFDREGDIFEVLQTLEHLSHGFIIRAVRNRSVERSENDDVGLSLDAVASAAVLDTVQFEVPRRPGQSARTATLTLRSVALRLRPPKNVERKGDSVAVGMVLVQEEAPPEGATPLCWYLITSEPCATAGECAAVVAKYRMRWKIEEFHMALKTGCGVERAQLETYHALRNLIAISSVSAWRLLSLRDAARSGAPGIPSDILTGLQLQLLSVRYRLSANPSAREVLRAVALLGGFAGRKGDGEPGWRTIWWGYQRLILMGQGAIAFGATCG